MANPSTRREFLKTSALLGTAWWVQERKCFSQSKTRGQKLNVACIGVDGKGSEDSDDAGRFGQVVALCDIDDLHLEKRGSIFKDARRFNDYREMLDVMEDKIDAVTVSIPDHSHAAATFLALKKGKHCFTQKPLTWSVHEARRVREVAQQAKVATQMGNQGTAHIKFRTGVELIRSGALGAVKEVHVWTNRPNWPQRDGRPAGSDPIPKNVHWDLFLGPAPERPFVNDVYHPYKWRGWLDFGTGAIGDMACHTANMAVMALELFDPTVVAVKETAGIAQKEAYPKYSVIEFQFPERTTRLFKPGVKLPACKMTWYDGGKRAPIELLHGEKRVESGSLIVGTEGTIYTPHDYCERFVALPRDKFKSVKQPERLLPRARGPRAHFLEWITACQTGKPTLSNFDYASRLTETMLLGNLALRAGAPIEWDAANQHVKNLAAANQFVSREYRPGYSI